MEFDKSKVYTALNADELKVGSKVIIANTLEDLKNKVKMGGYEIKLVCIRPEDTMCRFEIECSKGLLQFALAYLVKESEEKKLKCADLKIGDIITNGNIDCMVVTIDKSSHSVYNICVIGIKGEKWLSDDELKTWEKVEND